MSTGEDPTYYRYRLQGPNAVRVAEEAVDGALPEIAFFYFARVSIDGDDVYVDGHDVNAHRHGVAGERGYELFGPYDEGEANKRTLREVGRDHGKRRVGAETYQTPATVLGWLPLPVPAIYDGEEMRAYREWLPAKRGVLSIGGSSASNEIADYYVTPVEMGYGRVVDLDHEFVGRDAIVEELASPSRKEVTMEWGEDVVDTFATPFEEGETAKFLELPHLRWAACPYDAVLSDGATIGDSADKAYHSSYRKMLSLAVIDIDSSEPGTEVELLRGEPDSTTNPPVERHRQTTIDASVAPSPYIEDRRK